MALNSYLRLSGANQGEIKGSVMQVGREDSIMVIGWHHEFGTDARGRVTHRPVTITKELDRSTPLISNALAANELLTTWVLRLWQPSPSGEEVHYFTIELENAHVSSIQREMLNNKYPENMQHREREHVAFVYERIVQTDELRGVTSVLAGNF